MSPPKRGMMTPISSRESFLTLRRARLLMILRRISTSESVRSRIGPIPGPALI